MALEAKQAGPCIKKILRFPIRKGYRFVTEHPVLFSLGVLLYLLYRASPGFFAFLLSSSPVIICTALLLGVLLSYGEDNLPESGEDHKATPEISAFKVGNSSTDIHFEANMRHSVPEVRENTSSYKERENKQKIFVRERASEHVDLDDHVPLLRRVNEEDERYDRHNIPRALAPFPSMVSLRQEGGAREVIEKERESGKAYGQTSLFDGAFLSGLNSEDTTLGLFSSNEYFNKNAQMDKNLNQERTFPASTASKDREISEEKQSEESAGTSKSTCAMSDYQWKDQDGLNIDTSNVVDDNVLDSSLGSPWARISSQDGSSGFDSDGAESSSPDASMTDIAPVLDEIDPLLGANSSRPDPIPKDDSDTDSHVSEDHQIDDDSNDEGDEDDARDNVEGKKKDDGKEAAFLWTADDEKNLMDLGYSEMERNRRLELLMARRRSRKNIRFEVDNDLIDMDSTGGGRSVDDLSRFRAHVPPISVPRRNPFDLPFDSDEAIPGSAPSILHARKNPFDLPLEQSNDSGTHVHDSSNSGESVTSSNRGMLFRRHESFNFGRTDATQERRFSRLKPFIVPETVEWSSNNFQRQLSDQSESKLSSVTESDVVSSVADQEVHKDHGEEDSLMEHGLPALLRQDSDLTDVGSECSDGINSVDVELDNSDIDDREIALQHFVFERSQEREAYLASAKGKGHEEDDTLNSDGHSTMSFHPVPDLLNWEDGDDDSSLGAKPSFVPKTEVECSEWVSSSRPVEEGESSSGGVHLDTEVASSSNNFVLGARNPSEKDRNGDLMSYPNHEMPSDNLIHGSMELPSEFVNETLPVISRDLHPIPEERVVENFNMQEKHETTIFTDATAGLTGFHVIEEHFDVGSDGSLSSEVISSYPQANDVIQSPSSGPAEVSNPFVCLTAELNMVEVGDMKQETAAEYLLDSDVEAGKVYPEPMEDSGIDESFLSELDTVGDFSVEPMGVDQQVPDRASHSDSRADGNGVAADSVISPQTSYISLTMSEANALDSREGSPLVDDLTGPEFSMSFGASHGDPEQTVYNPRRWILEGSPFEAMDTELKPPNSEMEMLSDDSQSSAILEVMKNESMKTATDPEITFLYAKSLEDIENAFKIVSDGVVAEASTDPQTSHMVGVDMESEPKEVAGQLPVIDAKSVDDLPAAFEEHANPVVNKTLEENENKDGYGGIAESTKHDAPEPIQAESQLNVGDGWEAAEQVESTSNTNSSETKTHDDFDAVSKKLHDGSAKSIAQAIELEEEKEESEQQ